MSSGDDQTFQNDQANQEGWAVYHVNRAENHQFEIQRVDDPSDLRERGLIDYDDPVFGDDMDAIAFVVEKAREGSAYHAGALTFLRERSPSEFLSMEKDHDLAFLSTVARPLSP